MTQEEITNIRQQIADKTTDLEMVDNLVGVVRKQMLITQEALKSKVEEQGKILEQILELKQQLSDARAQLREPSVVNARPQSQLQDHYNNSQQYGSLGDQIGH